MSPSNDLLPRLPEFYQDRTILITGGSGFMGKVLVEKLLRSCPTLKTIYLLLRPKKGKPPADRLVDITKDVLFDALRAATPGVFGKLRVVAGDVTERGLGLTDRDRATLQEEVDIVFHSAASVRFDDTLVKATLINVRGPKEMLELALGMKHLQAFLHVSTTFCNIDKDHLHERIHPIECNWRMLLTLAEEPGNAYTLHCLMKKIIGRMPNTYTFTKALGEHVINDYRDRLPLVVVRPSIVLPPKFQGIIGWQDNVNGPVAFWMAAYVGLVRTLLMDPEIKLDYVPVDQAINAIIFVACHRALTPTSPGDDLPVYNCCNLMSSGTERDVIQKGVAIYQSSPTMKAIAYPDPRPVKSQNCYKMQIVIYHLLPYFFMDLFAKLAGQKPMLVKFLRSIYVASLNVSRFSTLQTNFSNQALRALESRMALEDREDFWFAKVVDMDMEYVAKTLLYLRVHLLKDPLDTLPVARRRLRRIFWMTLAARITTYLTAAWLFYTSGLGQWALAASATLHFQLLNEIVPAI